MILSGRLLGLASQGRLRLIIRPLRAQAIPLRVGRSYPIQERKQAVDHQGFPRRQRTVDPESGLTVETDEPRYTHETRCWVTIVDVVEKHVHEATDQEAKLAGFPGGWRELCRYWKETYDEWPADLERPGRVFDTPARFYFVEPDQARMLTPSGGVPTDPRGYSRSGDPLDAGEAPPDDFLEQSKRDAARRRQADPERDRERERKSSRSRAARMREAETRAVQLAGAEDETVLEVFKRVDKEIAELHRIAAEAGERRSREEGR